MEVSIWDYIKELKKRYICHHKQIKYLSHVCIYTHELNVYKVIVFADPNKKNGKRYGVNELIAIHDKNNNPKNITFPKLKKELIGSEVGNKIFMYYPKTEVLNCYEGESTIEDYKDLI